MRRRAKGRKRGVRERACGTKREEERKKEMKRETGRETRRNSKRWKG